MAQTHATQSALSTAGILVLRVFLKLLHSRLILFLPLRRLDTTRCQIQKLQILVVVQMREERVEPRHIVSIHPSCLKISNADLLVALCFFTEDTLINLPLLELLNLIIELVKINRITIMLFCHLRVVALKNWSFE
jgi:hypothetical protein